MRVAPLSKYSPLGDFLRAQTRSEVAMTFAQIEEIIGAKLPDSHRYRAWWSNNSFNSVMTKVWLEAGFESEQVDMEQRKLVFRRVQPKTRSQSALPHPLIGCLKGMLRIGPGVDLTDPADPDWGKRI
jgi:hypothetical protein